MSDNTKIEWATSTYNPIIGCSHVSSGCDNCYAERMAGRLASMPMKHNGYVSVVKWENSKPLPKWFGETRFIESALDKPLKWKKPRTIFVCSMGDLFHESVSFEWIDRIWRTVIRKAKHHTFLVLTKRPERMKEFIEEYGYIDSEVLPNVMLGVTAENQQQADKRIPILLQIPAAKRFVSIEPMLGAVDLTNYLSDQVTHYENQLDQVIVGGETGPNARPMHPAWVRSIRNQCAIAGVPFFFKSWGDWLPGEQEPNGTGYLRCDNNELYGATGNPKRQNFGTDADVFSGNLITLKIGKKKAGHLIDGKEWRERP